MLSRRLAVAVLAAAAIILSAPFVQQAFTAVETTLPEQFVAIGIGATAVPVGAMVLFALRQIRDRRLFRYLTLAASLAIGAGCTFFSALSFPETFHFVEYGLLAWLFYRAWRGATEPRPSGNVKPQVADGSVVVLPLLVGMLVATLDEWFQWFIPIRAGEARDVALNAVALGCGQLFAIAVDPPGRIEFPRRSLVRQSAWAAAAIVVFCWFFVTVHVGHVIHDPEIGSFRSRYTAAGLEAAARHRAQRWRTRPPVLHRLSQEDQYLAEGLWRVQQRDEAWSVGDIVTAWYENRILEKFYAPVLDTSIYGGARNRWPMEQAADAAERASGRRHPYASDAYRYPLYVWSAGEVVYQRPAQ